MKKEDLCIEARAEMGEHTCTLNLRPVGEIPGGLWSWSVYVDGNVHARGPGSHRKDPTHWYATLLAGTHCVVVRENNVLNSTRNESNTLQFTVTDQTEIVIDVLYANGEINLKLPTERHG
jgi:hypothetical protein